MLIKNSLRTFGIGAATLALSLSASVGSNATALVVPHRSMDAQIALIAPFTDIRVPEGAIGPVPTVLMFHGCGGLRQVQEDYAAAALDAGYGVMIVGSNAARGIGRLASMSQVCTGLRLWGRERAADVFAGVEMARQDSRIDATRLALIGWSHGGWTLLEALDDSGRQATPEALGPEGGAIPDLAGVQTAIALYPYCGFPVRGDGRTYDRAIPLHAILAENDVIAPARDCQRLFERSADAGFAVDAVVWPELTHAFDEPNPPADPRISFNAEAAAQARQRVIEILDRELAPQG